MEDAGGEMITASQSGHYNLDSREWKRMNKLLCCVDWLFPLPNALLDVSFFS